MIVYVMAIKTALWLGSSIAGYILDKRSLFKKGIFEQYLPRDELPDRLDTGVPNAKKDR